MLLGYETALTAKLIRTVRSVVVKLPPFNRRSTALLRSVAFLGFLAACEAVGVPKTNDPTEKLNYARLLLRDDRPLPAERLIGESIEVYESRGDNGGLATAHYAYAWFLAGDAVETSEGWYRENGFRDSPVDFDSRRQEAVRYFRLAATGFTQTGKFADAANAYFDLGIAEARNGDREPACRAFTESLKNFYTYLRWAPAPEFRVPKGVSSYEEYVISPAAVSGCPVSAGPTNPSRDSADDQHARELALAEEALILAQNILGSNHTAINGASEFRQRLVERQRGGT